MRPRIKIMPPKKGKDSSLARLQDDLAGAERELNRLKGLGLNVRGRLKKILEQDDRIEAIRAEIARNQQTTASQVMSESLCHVANSPFTTVEVKREIVKMVVPIVGPGSHGMPLDIDDESNIQASSGRQAQDTSVDGFQTQHGQDPTADSQQDLEMRFDGRYLHQDLGQTTMDQPMNLDNPQIQDPTAVIQPLTQTEGDGMPDLLKRVDSDGHQMQLDHDTASQGPRSDNHQRQKHFQLDNRMSVDIARNLITDQPHISVDGHIQGPVGQQFLHTSLDHHPTLPQGGNVHGPIDPRISVNEDGIQRVAGSTQARPVQGMAIDDFYPSPAPLLDSMSHHMQPGNGGHLDQLGKSREKEGGHPEPDAAEGLTNTLFDMEKYEMETQNVVPGGSSSLPVLGQEVATLKGGSSSSSAVRVQSGNSPLEWGWDLTVYDSKTGLYTFRLEDYKEEATRASQPCRDEGESENTSLERQIMASMQAKVDHFEQQRDALIGQQQTLVDVLSKGFNGDHHVTANHIRAINQSVKDIQLLEKRLDEHRKYLEESRIRYLSLCNEDDRACVERLKREIEDIKYRLENVDPELFNLHLEQKSLRDARTRVVILEGAIVNREEELRQYASVEAAGEIKKVNRNDDKASRPGRDNTSTTQRGQKKTDGNPKKGKGKKKAEKDEEEDVTDSSDEEGGKAADCEERAAKALENWIEARKSSAFGFTYRKLVREDVKFLPKAVTTSIDLVSVILASKKNKMIKCEYHRKGKQTAFKADSAFELEGQVGKSAKPMAGHLHCGCPIAEVALELFLWKTSRAFSSDPRNAGNVYKMSALHMLKPNVRSFWNQSIRDYTGLITEDFLAPDYGESTYATRIALIQLHTQIGRLKMLGVPIEIELKFKDHTLFNVPEGEVEYGLEVGVVMMKSLLEELWKKIEKRPVSLIPTVL